MAQQPEDKEVEQAPETKVEEGSTKLDAAPKPAKPKKTTKLGNGTVQEDF